MDADANKRTGADTCVANGGGDDDNDDVDDTDDDAAADDDGDNGCENKLVNGTLRGRAGNPNDERSTDIVELVKPIVGATRVGAADAFDDDVTGEVVAAVEVALADFADAVGDAAETGVTTFAGVIPPGANDVCVGAVDVPSGRGGGRRFGAVGVEGVLPPLGVDGCAAITPDGRPPSDMV